MPSEQQIVGVASRLANIIDDLGYPVDDIVGPIESEHPNQENETFQRYYLTSSTPASRFYILFTSEKDFGEIVYPYNVAAQLGGQLSKEHVNEILGNIPEWDDLDDEGRRDLRQESGREIIANTPASQLARAQFNISKYASSSIVEYRANELENGFPVEFQSSRGIFPYTERLSKREVDDRLVPVLIAGNRAARYIETSFFIHKDEDQDPVSYKLGVRS